MAVAHDAASESHTTTIPSTSEASFTWNHTPAGTPKGVLVYTFVLNSATETVTSVTYGGQSLTAVPGGSAADTANEPGRCTAWFLGSGIPTGVQAVVVNRTNNANPVYAICITVTAGADTETAGVALEQENQTLAEENVDDGSPGVNSERYCGLYWGLITPPSAGANSTALHSLGYASTKSGSSVRETTAGQGARPVGYDSGATSDDVAAVYLAVREVAAPITGPFPTYLH